MRHLLVMGISGTGKTTVSKRLSERLSRPMIEADDHHSAKAVARMSEGTPLTDDDRWGWLDRIGTAAAGADAPTVIACSALKEAYRTRLRDRLGPIDIVYLHGDRGLIASRMSGRADHFMPTSLIDSQLADLEPPRGPDVLPLDVADPVERLVEAAERFATRSREGR